MFDPRSWFVSLLINTAHPQLYISRLIHPMNYTSIAIKPKELNVAPNLPSYQRTTKRERHSEIACKMINMCHGQHMMYRIYIKMCIYICISNIIYIVKKHNVYIYIYISYMLYINIVQY